MLFFVITVVVMVIIYGNIQPDGLVLTVHTVTVNTTHRNSTTTTTTPRPTPPRIRGKQVTSHKEDLLFGIEYYLCNTNSTWTILGN